MNHLNFIVWCLAIGICLFQFADYWTTARILQHGGTELNPVMRLLFRGFGITTGLIIAKFYVALFVVVGAWSGWFNGYAFVLLVLLFGIYGTVVSHNIYQYQRG